MSSQFAQAIIKTIIYADIFDYPLTLEEIWKLLVELKIIGPRPISLGLKNLKLIRQEKGYYFLKDRKEIVHLRKQREKWSREKIKIAQEIGNLLKFIPSIKLVGVTGALAVDNSKEDDDIDLFIITASGLVWTTRFLSTLLIEFTGKRRHPNEKDVNNKICLNMFVDENHLEIPKKERDLFSAHEVIQMKPIWNRNNTYQRFLEENFWVKKYLPNACQELVLKENDQDTSDGGEATTSTPPRWRKQEGLTETFFRKFQLWYMRNRRTKEIIKDGIIRFHPHDAREWVMREYKNRIKKFQVIK